MTVSTIVDYCVPIQTSWLQEGVPQICISNLGHMCVLLCTHVVLLQMPVDVLGLLHK